MLRRTFLRSLLGGLVAAATITLPGTTADAAPDNPRKRRRAARRRLRRLRRRARKKVGFGK